MFTPTADQMEILKRLLASIAAGGLIGYERSYHGRPAGFRTHTLVAAASCLLMFVPVYETQWLALSGESIRMDPTRMAQGIMTGIGFLGAGAIVKEGLSVRGLTTAASIWITSTVGILAGIGFYFPLLISVPATLGILTVFRWIEDRMPTQSYYFFDVRFGRDGAPSEQDLRDLIARHGFTLSNFSYRLDGEGRILRHSMVIRTMDRGDVSRLAATLEKMENITEFRIAPTSD